MIDNLIYDQMKQIWINLELYFESYEFSNFLGFLWNFSKFCINLIQFILHQMNKKFLFYCVLTWHGQNDGATWWHMRPPDVTTGVYVRACVSARVHSCARMCE